MIGAADAAQNMMPRGRNRSKRGKCSLGHAYAICLGYRAGWHRHAVRAWSLGL